MRVIAGSAKGRVLKSPRNNMIRPTADKVKSAFYSMIGGMTLEGSKFLDLFAGTGNMGIEALSRGAVSCVFVDKSRHSIHLIQKNLHLTGFQDQAWVLGYDIFRALEILKNEEPFNVIYIDPPYNINKVDVILGIIYNYQLLDADGFIGVERDKRDHCPWLEGIPYQLQQFKVYGNTQLLLLRDTDGAYQDTINRNCK